MLTITPEKKKKSVSIKKIDLVRYGKGLAFFSIPPYAKAAGFP
ncbi:MAG: hypothetical protein ACFFCQ_01775 [Promethearchaeota archaeon]